MRSQPKARPVAISPHQLVALSFFLGFLALYIRTAAPSVLSGDSAEFQFAAPLLGVPHPTTYPLYVLLGKLATLAGPANDLARRVTLVSAGCAALAVALFFLLARRLAGAVPAALAALLFGFAPGLWNIATLTEVYALLMLLLVALSCLIAPATSDRSAALDPLSSPWRQRGAAFVAGLGFTHHGLFVIAGMPLFLGAVATLLLRRQRGVLPYAGRTAASQSGSRSNTAEGYLPRRHEGTKLLKSSRTFVSSRLRSWYLKGISSRTMFDAGWLKQLGILTLCFAAGMTPWLYPLIQYARYGPFTGLDYGLPRHYFWGSPDSWRAVIDLLTGGAIRRGIFRAPSLETTLATLQLVGERLLFEFGAFGLVIGLIGSVAMLRRNHVAWLGAAWIFLAILSYLLLLGPAVEDAPIFTLPMLLPWALWIAAGLEVLGAALRSRWPAIRPRWPALTLALLVLAALAWGYTRLPYANKRHLWLFRSFGEATLARLPPDAAVIAHWEQGTTLQYLVLVEHRRTDVLIDIVEPGDAAWGPRARQRYADRPVFFVGAMPDVAGLPVDLVRTDPYADLFQLRR